MSLPCPVCDIRKQDFPDGIIAALVFGAVIAKAIPSNESLLPLCCERCRPLAFMSMAKVAVWLDSSKVEVQP